MKKNNWALILALLLIALMGFSGVVPPKPHTYLKVMTYNIWNGFEWGKDTVRKGNWIRWIQAKNPDVLALQELCGYDEDKLKTDAAKWGHPYVKILKTEGYPVGITSKQPINLKERVVDKLWHGMLHCETYGIDFFVVHLSPADSDFRLREANVISEKVKDSEREKYIILGDFNAHSPFDEELLEHNQKLKDQYLKGKSEQYSNLRLGEFDYSVVSAFLALPAIDVSNRYIDITDRYTFPSPALIGSYRKTMDNVIQTRERIDYILTSPVISKSCTNVTIYNKGEAETFSDHYPVMAEFSFSTK